MIQNMKSYKHCSSKIKCQIKFSSVVGIFYVWNCSKFLSDMKMAQKDLNIWQETIKVPEENILWHKSQQCFLRSVSQSNRNKPKINKWDLTKLINFCITKETINKIKRYHKACEKTFVNDVMDKGLIPKIYKQLI